MHNDDQINAMVIPKGEKEDGLYRKLSAYKWRQQNSKTGDIRPGLGENPVYIISPQWAWKFKALQDKMLSEVHNLKDFLKREDRYVS